MATELPRGKFHQIIGALVRQIEALGSIAEVSQRALHIPPPDFSVTKEATGHSIQIRCSPWPKPPRGIGPPAP